MQWQNYAGGLTACDEDEGGAGVGDTGSGSKNLGAGGAIRDRLVNADVARRGRRRRDGARLIFQSDSDTVLQASRDTSYHVHIGKLAIELGLIDATEGEGTVRDDLLGSRLEGDTNKGSVNDARREGIISDGGHLLAAIGRAFRQVDGADTDVLG